MDFGIFGDLKSCQILFENPIVWQRFWGGFWGGFQISGFWRSPMCRKLSNFVWQSHSMTTILGRISNFWLLEVSDVLKIVEFCGFKSWEISKSAFFGLIFWCVPMGKSIARKSQKNKAPQNNKMSRPHFGGSSPCVSFYPCIHTTAHGVFISSCNLNVETLTCVNSKLHFNMKFERWKINVYKLKISLRREILDAPILVWLCVITRDIKFWMRLV